MSTIQDRLANPANPPAKLQGDRKRVPMSLPMQQLAVPDIPGYKCHWFLGKPNRLERAQLGGYVFVNQHEVQLNRVGVGNDPSGSGHTDLGSRVSVISGTDEAGGQPQRLYLMKIPLELWEEDQAGLAARNEQVAAALRGDKGYIDPDPSSDNTNRYIPEGATNRNLFTPKRRP